MVYILACEPVLSRWSKYAVDFYSALATITSGAIYPLSDTRVLSACIVGSALQGLELMKLGGEFQKEIAESFFKNKEPMESIIKRIYAKLRRKQKKISAVNVATIYRDSPQAKHNREVFIKSGSLAEARTQLREVTEDRLIPDYADYANGYMTNLETGEEIKLPQESETKLQIVLKNTGKEWITLEMYHNETKLRKPIVVQPNHMHTLELPLHSIRNFILECGRFRKNFSRTFSSNADLDLAQIWEQSA